MTANTLYLVCAHHPNQVDAFRLADRAPKRDFSGGMDAYSGAIHLGDRALNKWFVAHAHCGGSFDHFSLAFERPKDHDIPIDKPLANAVHLQLVTSGAER